MQEMIADPACTSIISTTSRPAVFAGIDAFLAELESVGTAFQAYPLPDAVFVVELVEGTLLHDARGKEVLAESWQSYMFALCALDWYRAVLNRPLFRMLRRTRFVRRIFVVQEEKV